MTNEKDLKIGITTHGDARGAKEVAKSIDDLETQVRHLEAELKRVPIGGKSFEQLAEQLKFARKGLGDAESEARRLGATVGRGGNAGMAVLEFSRALEDAQYGVRGVLNNIPGLIAMLGGGAGLAGVISIAAVVGTQLWERLSDSKDSEDAMDAMAEAAEKLASRLKAVRDARREAEKMTTRDLARPLKEQETALKLQTQAFRDNIAAIKDRIVAESALDAALVQTKLGEISANERDGKLSPADADIQRGTVLKDAKQREIARAGELAKLDETVAIETKEAARRQLRLAQFEKQSSEERLREAEALDAALKAELRKRNEIKSAQAAVDAAQGDFDRLNFGGLAADGDSLRQLLEAAERERRLADATGADASENITVRLATSLEKLLAAQERLAGVEVGKTPRGEEKITKELQKSVDQIESFKKALMSAEEAITSRSADLKLAEQSAAAAEQRGAERAGARDNQQSANALAEAQEVAAATEQRAADEVARLLDEVLRGLGAAASSPEVQQKAGAIRAMLENGLQRSEADQSQALLQQLIGKMDSGDRARGQLYQQMLQGMEKAVTEMARDKAAIDDLNRRIDRLSHSLRGAVSW